MLRPTATLYVKGNYNSLLNRIKRGLIGPTTFEVGLPQGMSDQDDINKATWNEFGTKRIPSRPFMRNTMEQNRAKYIQNFMRDGRRLANGLTSIREVLGAAGREAKNDMVRTIDKMVPPPNAAATVKKKGFNHPLIETGKMRAAITYRLR